MASPLQLIHEDFDPVCVPTSVIAVQGDRAFYFEGRDDDVTESIGSVVGQSGLQIVESLDKLELVEDASGTRRVKDGRFFIEGPFSQYDVRNANGRVYKKDFWEEHLREGSYLRDLEKKRGLTGMNEHPADGRSHISKVSLITEGLRFGKENNAIIGRAEICSRMPEGAILEAAFYHNVRFGVSSRAKGVVNSDGSVDKDKSRVVAWDAVVNPSVGIAFPKPVVGESEGGVTTATRTTVAVPFTIAENVQVIAGLEQAESIAEGVIDPATGAEALKAIHETLTDALADVVALPDVPAAAPRRRKVQLTLMERLKETFEAMQAGTAMPTFESVNEAIDDDSQTVNENEELAADKANDHHEQAIVEFETEIDRLNGLLAERGKSLTEAKRIQVVNERKIDVLLNSAVDRSRARSETPIRRELNRLLESTPALRKHEGLLAKADTVEQLHEAAGLLIPKPTRKFEAESERSAPRIIAKPFGLSNMNRTNAVHEDEQDHSQVVNEDSEEREAIPGLKTAERVVQGRAK